VVFTVPHELNVLALNNPREFYELLFRASAATALDSYALNRKQEYFNNLTRPTVVE
jgi:hypothetical protein